MDDLTIIYYTSNYLEEKNPYFLANTKKQLVKAARGLPIVAVSHKPCHFDYENYANIVLGDIGRSHLNIYRQILEGCKAATTKYVAMAEDDILYSDAHFNFKFWIKPEIYEDDIFMYDMAKVSLFTWTKPSIFSFRTKRRVVNQLIAKREMLIEALEERFNRFEELKSIGWTEEKVIKYWGDPGRYENILGVTPRKTYEFYSWVPSIVFSHEYAYGYEFNQGKKKKHGDLRIIELADWGRAENVLKLWEGITIMVGQPDELYGSHLPVLSRMMEVTHGDVLELGMGLYSTPLLHTICVLQDRKLVSFDNDKEWFDENKKWASKLHRVEFVPEDVQAPIQNPDGSIKHQIFSGWNTADFDDGSSFWSIAFVDHKPAKRRKDEIKRLAHCALFVIIHDTESESDKYFKYSWMEKYYKYKYQYSKLRPFTSVWSNFVDPSYFF